MFNISRGGAVRSLVGLITRRSCGSNPTPATTQDAFRVFFSLCGIRCKFHLLEISSQNHTSCSSPVGPRPQTSCSRLWLKTCHWQLFFTRRPTPATTQRRILRLFSYFVVFVQISFARDFISLTSTFDYARSQKFIFTTPLKIEYLISFVTKHILC